jgi:predicted deacylase
MNPLGLDTLQRLMPVYETDLNRKFPGHAQGPSPQRFAEAAMRHLHDAALVIDIHAPSRMPLLPDDHGEEFGPPRIAFVAGLHGNELNGVFVLSRLTGLLQEVAEGLQAGLQLRQSGMGTILPFP